MTRRGLALALQRLHDDPSFAMWTSGLIEDPLALYDLDDREHALLMEAISRGEVSLFSALARELSMDWSASQLRPVLHIQEVEEHSQKGMNEDFLDSQPVDYETPRVGSLGPRSYARPP